MKKMLFCMACMLLICASAVAQNRQGGRNRQGNNRQFNAMAVIDTAVINHIGLSEEMLAQVYTLQKDQDEEAKNAMTGMMPERGKRMNEESIANMQKMMKEMKSSFRGQLRNLIGDEMYITYLEKQLDNRRMMNFMGAPGGQRGNWGGQGGQGRPGGFGGGEPGGFGGGPDF